MNKMDELLSEMENLKERFLPAGNAQAEAKGDEKEGEEKAAAGEAGKAEKEPEKADDQGEKKAGEGNAADSDLDNASDAELGDALDEMVGVASMSTESLDKILKVIMKHHPGEKISEILGPDAMTKLEDASKALKDLTKTLKAAKKSEKGDEEKEGEAEKKDAKKSDEQPLGGASTQGGMPEAGTAPEVPAGGSAPVPAGDKVGA